ncbi:MAG: hypothetical protein IT366_17155 [Candidatus Hydrogenedentes bacterium]|nr:hypothetical protein [Candidatus Hydrogenedentota bacterium]
MMRKTFNKFVMAAMACACVLTSANAQPANAPQIELVKPSPWRPPFGIDRPGAPSTVRVKVSDAPVDSAFIVEAIDNDVSLVAIPLDQETLRKSPVEVSLPSHVDKAVLIEERSGKRTPVAITAIERDELEVEATAEPLGDARVNPIDLGTLLPPQGCLVLGPRTGAIVRVAASWMGDGEQHYIVRAWYSHATEVAGEGTLTTQRGDRESVKPLRPFNHTDSPAPWETHIALDPPPLNKDRSVLHVTLEDEASVQKWSKDIPVMLVAEHEEMPVFGAFKTKLRYDQPISVLDRETNALSTIPYEEGWDPALEDVVVALPGGGRFVFWRGSSYVPFWMSPMGTGLSYEWAETGPMPGGFVDCVEPLMDKELRYGRVEIIESTVARVHVRWTYQSTDFVYNVWGDAAQEDYYFYRDGYGTRVLTLKSALDSKYELSEFIVIAPQDAYPLEFLPVGTTIRTFDLKGRQGGVAFPKSDVPGPAGSGIAFGQVRSVGTTQPVFPPLVYRAPLHNGDAKTAIYFNPRDTFQSADLTQFSPFFEGDEMATPAYWGSHWPLSRGKTTGGSIDDRIKIAPSHNSLMSWAMKQPAPVSERSGQMIDALGKVRDMRVQQWAWLIGYTDASDDEVLDIARSYALPPAIEAIKGARVDVESYNEATRALCVTVESRDVTFRLVPQGVCVNPVFEMNNAPADLMQVSVGALVLGADSVAWDGKVLWLRAILREPTQVRITFRGTS